MDRSTARPYFIRRWTSAPALSTPYRYGGEERREKWRLAMWAWLLPLFPPCDVRSHHTHKFRILILFFFVFFFFLFYLFFFIVVSLNLFLILRRRSVCVHILKYIHTDCLLGIRGVPECVCVWILFPRRHDAHHRSVLGKETLSVKKLLIAFRSPAASQRRWQRRRYLTDRSRCAGHSCVIAKLFSLPTAHDGRLMDFSEYLFLFFFFAFSLI